MVGDQVCNDVRDFFGLGDIYEVWPIPHRASHLFSHPTRVGDRRVHYVSRDSQMGQLERC